MAFCIIYYLHSNCYPLYSRLYGTTQHLVNIENQIQGTCHYGRQRNEKCKIIQHGTEEFPILCLNFFRVLYVPTLWCEIHNHQCKIHAYRNDSEKFVFGKGDQLINRLLWWICVPFGGKEGSERDKFHQRYLFTHDLLVNLVDCVMRTKESVSSWCKTKISNYAEHMRQILLQNNETTTNLNKDTMIKDIQSFFSEKTVKKILTEFGKSQVLLLMYPCIFALHIF